MGKANIDRKELQAWYKGFAKDVPTGALEKADFQRLYKQFFPFGDASAFATRVFEVFDVEKKGQLGFKEFIIGLSVTSRGKRAFRLYDADADGFISRKDMLSVLRAVYRMVGSMVKPSPDDETPEKRVIRIFDMMSVDLDGAISFDTFVQGVKSEPALVDILNLYSGLV